MLLTAASSGKMWLAEAGECLAGMPRFDCSSEPDLAKLDITELTPRFPDFLGLENGGARVEIGGSFDGRNGELA
jgi:hypothetical protein